MARSIDDIALAMRALTNDSAIAPLPKDSKLRIGVCRTSLWETAQEATRHALSDTAERLRSRGDQVEEISLPERFGALSTTREVINDCERALAMAHEWQQARGSISESLAKSIARGFQIPAARYVEALALVEECRRMMAPIFERHDVLLAPTVTGEASLGLAYTGHHGFQSIWTQLRVPTIGLPTHQGPSGLPVSIQLIGPA
jgi:amidase